MDKSTFEWHDRVGLFVNIVGTFTTMIGVYLLLSQMNQTESALAEAKEANRIAREGQATAAAKDKEERQQFHDQLGVAKGGTDAAAKANVLTQRLFDQGVEASRLDQRAWVGPRESKTTIEVGKKVTVQIEFTNTGKTPALDLYGRMETVVLGTADSFKPVYKSQTPKPSNTVLQPQAGKSFRFIADKELTDAQLATLNNPLFVWYVFGEIHYEDIFKQKHLTTFCRRLFAEGRLFDCETYNYAD